MWGESNMSESEIDIKGKQTRMEVAYGSGDGDEELTAVVAKKEATLGTIFNQSYKQWEGILGPRWMRNYSIYRHHVYGIFTSKGHRYYHPFVRLTILVIFLASLAPIPLLFFSSLLPGQDGDFLSKMWGINRYNLWGQILGYFPRNLCMWPLLTALVVGGMISDDRKNGTSALYFSRPINRFDYTVMKYLSVSVILGFVIVFSYFAYYTSAIVFRGESWAYLVDTLPIFLSGIVAGIILVITYTSLGLALSSISQSRFFAAIGFLSIIYGTKIIALLIEMQFDTTIMYILSPYDCLAHFGQFLLGLDMNYDHPLGFSIISLIFMNIISVGILVSRISSMEVTRE